MIIRTNGGQRGDWALKCAVMLQTEIPKVGAQCHNWTRALKGRHFLHSSIVKLRSVLRGLPKNWEIECHDEVADK